ncbi:hypothetical protein D9M69_403520 [compost metagenome]
MLDAQAELGQHVVRQVARRLGDEVDADALRADQPHHLLQALLQRPGRVVEQQVRLVEEQRQHRLVRIAALGQLLEQLGQQPEQEGRVDLGRLVHQLAGIEQMDAAAAVRIGAQEVFQLQRRLAEERLGALLFEQRQAPQQGLGRGAGEQRAVLAEHLRVFLEVVEQRLEVLQVEQQQALAVGHLEGGEQRGLLAVAQLQQVGQQQRAHFRERGAQRVAGLAGDVPQAHRVGLRLVVQPGHAGDPLGHLALRIARRGDAAQVALDVGGEHRDAGVAEAFGQVLQGHGLAGAGGAGDQPVAVGQLPGLADRLAVRAGTNDQFVHRIASLS